MYGSPCRAGIPADCDLSAYTHHRGDAVCHALLSDTPLYIRAYIRFRFTVVCHTTYTGSRNTYGDRCFVASGPRSGILCRPNCDNGTIHTAFKDIFGIWDHGAL